MSNSLDQTQDNSDAFVHRKSFLHVTVGKQDRPKGDISEVGVGLVQQCLEPISDLERFPPQLFLLFATPAFRPYRPLLAGIRNVLFQKQLDCAPLIGSSVAACLFDTQVHEEGVLLICLASRFISVKGAVGANANRNPHQAIDALLTEFALHGTMNWPAGVNRRMIVFLPGFGEDRGLDQYRADELVAQLLDRTYGCIPMFGGVSSGGLDRTKGFQFLNDNVYDDAMVAALVSSKINNGITLSHDLVDTGETYRIAELDKRGYAIQSFAEGSADEVAAQIEQKANYPPVFAQISPHGDQVITSPIHRNGRFEITRRLTSDTVVHIFKPNPQEMVDVSRDRVEWIMRRHDMAPEILAGCISVGSAERYRSRERTGFVPSDALAKSEEILSHAICVGCYMEGEIGVDQLGRSVLGNWSVSSWLLADDIPAYTEFALGFTALARQSTGTTRADCVKNAAAAILESLDEAGYPGGMVSLVLRDGDKRWIVAHSALGNLWKEKVLPLTRRDLSGNDVLALVAEAKNARYVRDSRDAKECCDSEAVAGGRILSQYIIPMIDDDGEVMGMLQVDLGDMRERKELPPEHKEVFDAIGTAAAGMLCRAIRTEELVLSRKLDEILANCLDMDTVDEAAEHFICRVAEEIQADAHIRLRSGDNNLRLAGGIGDYFKAASELRRKISISDGSPSAEAVRRNQPRHTNDAAKDPAAKMMRARFRGTPLGMALEKHGAYANFPITTGGGEPIGMFNISSSSPWFFSESTLRSLQDISARLYVLLTHIENRQLANRSFAEQRLLAKAVSRLEGDLSLHKSLAKQAAAFRDATSADVVSCFLWDTDRDRFVLRAQSGWHDQRWIDAAWYERTEGVIGQLAASIEAMYIPDLRPFAKDYEHDKYLGFMFELPPTADETLEVLSFPMRFGDQLVGIWLLYRKISTNPRPTGTPFSIFDEDILREAAEAIAAYGYAVQRQDLSRSREREMKRFANVTAMLLRDVPLEKLLDDFCLSVTVNHGARVCAIYLASEDGLLRRESLHMRGAYLYEEPECVAPTSSPLWAAYSTGNNQEIRYEATIQQDQPALVRRDGFVHRVCLPLDAGRRRLGVLDICWRGAPPAGDAIDLPQYHISNLRQLASSCAMAIYASRLRVEKDAAQREQTQWRLALDVLALNLRLGVHNLASGVGAASHILKKLEQTELNQDQTDLVKKGLAHANKVEQVVKKAIRAAGRLAETKRTRCDLRELLLETLDKYRESFTRSRITVHTQVDEVRLNADRDLLLEAFENVIDNSVKAMPDGGILQVSVRSKPKQGACALVFSDTGVGMSREIAERVLNWEKIENRAGGEGLGLFLTRLYCKIHGGDLEVNSSPGAGTTVILTLALDGNGSGHVS